MPLLSECGFTSFLQYSPHGSSEQSRLSKQVTLCVKRNGTWPLGPDGTPVIPTIVASLAKHREDTPVIAQCFQGEVIAVPVPGHAPKDPGSLWVAEQICIALRAADLVSDVRTLLRRASRVTKSAGAANRPSPLEHYNTIAVEPGALVGKHARLLLVDDVVTRGATILACASRLRDAYPSNAVHVFALIRTMSGIEISTMSAPVSGLVSTRRGWLHREP